MPSLPKPLRKLAEPSVALPVLLVLAVVLLSVGGTFLFGSWLVAVIVSLAVALIVLMVVLLRTLFGRERAARLDRGLEAEETAEGGAPALPGGVEEGFARALDDIRSSRLGEGGLQAIPWIAVLGETGAGKTALLQASGLTLPAEFAHRPQAGPTRGCAWWLTNEAIALDTAGAFLDSEDSSVREEWQRLLRLLRRTRPACPLNGVVVALPVTSLLGRAPAELEATALALRRRLNELEDALGMVVPVYLVVTRLDQVEGFVETARWLSASQWSQVVGWTHDRRQLTDARERVQSGLAEVQQRLEAAVPDLLLREQDPRARRRLFAFPQELGEVIRAVAAFAGRAFAPSAYDEVPFLRGVYLTSSRREGATLSPLLHRLAQDHARNTVDGACAEGGIFTRDLFHEVVVGDRNLAIPADVFGPAARRLVHVACAAAFAVLALWWGIASVENWQGIRALHNHAATAAAGSPDLAVLEELRRTIERESDSMSILRRGGLGGPMDAALEDAREVFVHGFEREFEAPTKRRLTSAVQGGDDRAFEALAQLALDVTWLGVRADPDEATRPDLSAFAPISRSETERVAFRKGYDDFVRWADDGALRVRIETERERVSGASARLLELGPLEAWSERSADVYPPARYRQVGIPASDGAPRASVPGAYTRRGWEGLVSDLIRAVDRTGGASSSKVEQFRRGYVERFDRHWRGYLLEAPLPPRAEPDVERSPYLELVEQIHRNTGADVPRPDGLPAWIATLRAVRSEEAPPPEEEGEEPPPAPWERYRDALSQVAADVAAARERGETALQLAVRMADDEPTSFARALELVRELVPTQGDAVAASKLREVLAMPIADGASAALEAALVELDRRWRDRIAQPYARSLDTPGMEALYAPESGELASFRQDALGRFFADGRPAPVIEGRTLPFGDAFLAWMRRAERMQRILYPGGFGPRPSLSARLEGVPSRVVGSSPYRVSRREIRMVCSEGVQTFRYREGSGSHTFQWSPDCTEVDLRVWALDADGREVELRPQRRWTGPLAFPSFLQQADRGAGKRLDWSFRYLEPELELRIAYRLRGGDAVLGLEHRAPPSSMRN